MAFNLVQSVLGFFNAGTLRKTGTSVVNLGGVPFNNESGGLLDLTGGTLAMGTDGTWSGADITLASGAVLQIDGGTKTWAGTFKGSGAGRVLLNAGTVTMGTGSATVNFPTGLLEIGGNASLNGTSLTNTGTITVTGAPDLSTTLGNSGTIRNIGTIDFYTGGRINNLAGGIFEVARTADGATFNQVQSAPGFLNAGTLRKTGTTVANLGGVTFNNELGGLLEINAGTLSMGTSGTWNGATFTVASGALVQLDGGTKTWTGTFQGTGAGRVLVSAGTVTMGTGGATVNFPTGLLEVGGDVSLGGAALTNTGTMTVTGAPNLSTTLINSGTIRNTGIIDFYTGGRINNLAAGLFEVARTADGTTFNQIQSAPGFFNAGTLRKTGANVANLGGVIFNNETGGLLEINTGTLSMGTSGTWSGATFTVASGALVQLDGGTKTWTGTF